MGGESEKGEDPTWTDDEDAFEETRRLRKSKGDTFRGILADIPILGWILNFIIGFISRKIDEVKRRRRSFKIALYFQAQMVVSLAGFLTFLIVSLNDMSWLSDTSRVAAECQLAASAKLVNGTTISFYDSQGVNVDVNNLHTYVTSERIAVPCTNEDLTTIDAACTLADLYVLSNSFPTTHSS